MAVPVTCDPNRKVAGFRPRERAGELQSMRLGDAMIEDLAKDSAA